MKNPFKKEVTSFQSVEPETPYQRAQKEWDDRIGSSRVQARNWRWLAFISLLLALVLLIMLMYFFSTKHDRLFIAEVTQTGRVVNVAPLVIKYNPTVAQQKYFIAKFVELIRSLPLDPVVAKQNWFQAYNFLSQRGAYRLNNFFAQNNPAEMLGKKTLSVKIDAINPISSSTFEVDWTEIIVNANGQTEGQKTYTGVFTVITQEPTSEKEILQNPLGIYIVDFNISPRT